VRLLVAAAIFFLLAAVPASPQQKQASPTTSGRKCGPRAQELPFYYEEAALENIEPPEWRHELIRISVGTGTKLDLWTDGKTFKLWTAAVRFRDVEKSLLDLNRACRLPTEPDEASALLKVKWEGADLPPGQFAKLHQDFTSALAQYSSKAQARYDDMMATTMRVIYLDTSNFRIVYDNSYEHIEADVWNDPENDKPLLDWIKELQKLAAEVLHHSVGFSELGN
jgi:hypothetical protein